MTRNLAILLKFQAITTPVSQGPTWPRQRCPTLLFPACSVSSSQGPGEERKAQRPGTVSPWHLLPDFVGSSQ